MAILLFIRSLYLLPLLFFVAANAFFEELPFWGLDPFQSGFNPGDRGGGGGNNEVVTFKPIEITGRGFKGSWELASENSGVSAMHLILSPPNNKAIMFDSTIFTPAKMELPKGKCRPVPGKPNEMDCWVHAVEYDIDTADVRPLKILTDSWCSSGGHDVDGTIVNTGGWNDGGKATRWLSNCKDCDWRDYATVLSGIRWYATQQILADGSFIIVGGRRKFSYEYLSKEGNNNAAKDHLLPFLRETTDKDENNLYPFVYLSTDNNIFLFANNRSILINTKTNTIVREFPVMPGGSRNYPASGMSALLPIRLEENNPEIVKAEVIVCGGTTPNAFYLADTQKLMLDALKSCGRLEITNPKAQWVMEDMPMGRVMSDMLILPTGDLLMINGAEKGASGWQFADVPALNPVLYSPDAQEEERFTVLEGTTIPRMYHSTSAVLPDGKILVAGSNTNDRYSYTKVKYPTEFRVEKFSPPYLDPMLAPIRPEIVEDSLQKKIKYGEKIRFQFSVRQPLVNPNELEVTMYYPPFTTHGFSMNQRMLVLAITRVFPIGFGQHEMTALAPPSGVLAPPGYYLLFLVHRGVPSPGQWIHIK
ncbi:aldehyde oxidase GLOX1-like [Telopea speciosissima]|uniref:aldehyde oxidase GLOX1-like n=1 Tax=Telopea speciosissima TaxID=54955 RepID=UPI001CC7818D|nr:aldehyde oxidase GLOX1-like [Telopea speciosissima]